MNKKTIIIGVIGSYHMGWKHKTRLGDGLKAYYEWYVSGRIKHQQLYMGDPPHKIR
jgi:dTDP-D-glucose 4,6-dehydratase